MPESTNVNSLGRLKRLLILGHSGFIGSRLVKYYQQHAPHIELIGKSFPGIDLTREEDAGSLKDFLSLDTGIIMLSAVKRQFGDDMDVFSQNLAIAMNLCRLLQKHPVGRFIFFSSAAVYGEDIHNIHITEETAVCPTSYYGMVKFISERLFWKIFDLYPESSLLILRPPTIYGPGDEGDTYGPVKFTNAAVRDKELVLWGDGTELREFMFIDDVVDIVYRLTFSPFDGVLNLASGTSYSFVEVLKAIESVSGKKLRLNSSPRTKNKVDNAFNNSILLKQIGSYSFTTLFDGVKKMYAALT